MEDRGESFLLGVSGRIYLLHFVSQFNANALKNIGSLYCDDDEIKSQFNKETFDDENDSFGTEASCCENELGESQTCYLFPPYVQSSDEAQREPIVEASKKWIDPEASLNEKGGAAVDEIPKESDFGGASKDS
ncbi:hypothetical protein KIW84_032758 [Lathyrus oleraceus]|uniref:Uncharacterized protein n=1 Tax=Pisum sativum TaxID=3888 RepID=A0A9D4XVR5_PEA|nr:hypothetical protein KIW84_032758 [Pisum sativum]